MRLTRYNPTLLTIYFEDEKLFGSIAKLNRWMFLRFQLVFWSVLFARDDNHLLKSSRENLRSFTVAFEYLNMRTDLLCTLTVRE